MFIFEVGYCIQHIGTGFLNYKLYKQKPNNNDITIIPIKENIVNKNIHLFYSLYAICKSRDIELRMFQMMNAFNRYQIKDNDYEHDIKLAHKSLISNPISTEINEDMFWGRRRFRWCQ